MEILKIGDAKSQVFVGETYLNLAEYLPKNKQIIVIADDNILKNYGDFFLKWSSVINFTANERLKTLKSASRIYRLLLKLKADRNSFIVAVGGGIVCDVAGYAASTFMRGIPFGFVSTTLLSQVDASVGGKNGLNLFGYKNMIGTFTQPQFVICDTKMLNTLPEREFIAGFAEIVKAALIRNAELFDYIEQNAEKAVARNPEVIRHLVVESVKIKAEIVAMDEREQGIRRILNFGHTFGHAIEGLTGISHGEAVSIGMMIAARRSVDTAGLKESSYERLKQLLLRLGLPVATDAQPEALLNFLQNDKKREGDDIHFVMLNEIGKAIVCKTPIKKLNEFLEMH